MLELKKITKIYRTDNYEQKALDEVTLNFRKNEFTSILGPSGSGKTTLLNIIGGLDKYDSGDLIINETSTKKYKDSDWDTYRNHSIGFVFQNYNLISHQSVLANVELALTLSGVTKKERTKKAKEALKSVGLEKHINKRPSQLSGGQMQRVAIARALVNDPDILLADEPTGALDSETSVQIMDLLKKIAKNKLVIMVTHNEELAKEYSTRIIKLKDGHVIDDSDPYDGKINTKQDLLDEMKNTKKTSMNLKTALSLSFNNLMTKKGRTFLTAFAGSIGIIGIALILSLSNGVQEYVDRVQEESLTSYPMSIAEKSSSYDLTSKFKGGLGSSEVTECDSKTICTTDDITTSKYITKKTSVITNNLDPFKKYLDENYSEIENNVTALQYQYNLSLNIYTKYNNSIVKVNPNKSNSSNSQNGTSVTSSVFLTDAFSELIDNEELLDGQYEVLSGKMPENYNELVLVVDENYNLPLSVAYSLGLEDRADLDEIVKKTERGETLDLSTIDYKYNDIEGLNYKLVLNTSYYVKENNSWIDKTEDEDYLETLYNNGIDLKIVGIAKISDDATTATSGFIGYTHDLVEYVINENNSSDIVKEQKEDEIKNIITNVNFDEYDTYDSLLEELGSFDLDSPSTINIYPKDYEAKEAIEEFISEYNKNASEEDKIEYNDMVGTLLSSVTSVVNMVSYILIGFVSISLIVSSIMIAIITYISVLERTKEIGILRAIGASKKDISRVFNAETIIEGFIAGVLGVGIAILLSLPINLVVNKVVGISSICSLPILGAIFLIALSIGLTVFAGLIPAHKASKKDPVESLRTE